MDRIIISILFLAFSLSLDAQGPPITTGTPVMLGLEGRGVRTFGKYISKENASIYVQPIGLPYNISSKFQIGGIFPVKFITPKEGKTTGGLADITVFAKYQLFKIDGKAKTFRVIAHLKQSFPTGKTSSTPKIGSGVYRTYIGLIMGKISSRAGVYTDFGYNVAGGGASDNFLYNFSVGIPLLPHKYPQRQVNAYLEFNGNYIFDSRVNTLFLSPGIQWIPGRRILLESSFQLPLIQKNITANKTNFAFLLGTRFLLN